MGSRISLQAIKHIPGDNGFTKVSTESSFIRIAHRLEHLGVPADEVVELLQELWNAVSHEYGA